MEMEEGKYIKQRQMIVFYLAVTLMMTIFSFISVLKPMAYTLLISNSICVIGGVIFLWRNGIDAVDAGKSDVSIQKDYEFLQEKYTDLERDYHDLKNKEKNSRISKNDKAIFYLLYEKVYKNGTIQSKNQLLSVINKELQLLGYPCEIGGAHIYKLFDDEYIKLK
ncbi:hypothetical protein [Orbus mooreae]|uniref:hypothetical protein n=1 Tax=Orbus mooreae TaxID=3074107 RepID=UPI00370DD1D7